jgi:pyrroloquinoline quinone (PQQ) biosynthesis protein C
VSEQFAERIERYVVDTYFRNLPPLTRAMALAPTRGTGQAFVLEWTKFSRQFPRWVGAIVANCPEFPVIAFEIENLFSEVVRDPASNTNHYELLVRLGAGLGLTREQIESHGPSPAASRAFDYWWRIARQPEWLLGFTAINGLEILGDRTLPRRYQVPQSGTGLGVAAWRSLGLDEDTLEFFRVSDEADEGHGREAVEIIARYTAPKDEERVLGVLAESMACLREMQDAMWALAQRLDHGT